MRVLALILMLALAAPALAQNKPGGGPDPIPVSPGVSRDRVLPELAYTLGELHYLAFACEGNHSQGWRTRMTELLDLEAPAAGYWRERMIDQFNNGFRDQQRYAMRCGAEAEAERRELASRGQRLSDALLAPLVAEAE
ncbi:MAG: TIGR02301 family protein [Maricaulis sp.]|jgi:uncharacterized protein (TIGR02301 family)|nr:TIGR02301 family protein [Maricaulis sp.]HAQ35102.1 TIGR02301 family protein [Alphaproteobacteria bacterium]|tara:strand:- start:469 stop:882 length:414 start_codon:yes stop_codon:yes gene_type:complete